MTWLSERPSRVFWTALLITLSSVVWQRMTGPTYPVRGSQQVGPASVSYRLLRSHSSNESQPVEVSVENGPVSGVILWRHYPLEEPWSRVPMRATGNGLKGLLPAQPPAGKLEYQVLLMAGSETALIPARPAVTRFKGDVPAKILLPHILAMFGAMLWSTAAGLKALAGKEDLRTDAIGTFLLIALGGFLFGPLVQKAAFGKYWTGFPYGHDLTDNKTLIAGVFWGGALLLLSSRRLGRAAVVTAAAVTLLVFAIPHSLFGSQLDWKKEGQSPSPQRPVSSCLPPPSSGPWHA